MNRAPRIVTDLIIRQSPRWTLETTRFAPMNVPGHLGAMLRALRAAIIWRSYDVVISANVRTAALYGFCKRLMPGPQPRLMLLEARFDDPQPTLSWKCKAAFQRFAFAAFDAICVSARQEARDYSQRLELPESRFHFVPWHTNVVEPGYLPVNDGYIFAAGRTGRDWRTFARAAEQLSVEFVVVISSSNVEETRFPSNVKTYVDIPYDRYRQLLERARVVVVPLEVHSYSSGQVALLEAMALGKPVICTRVLGTEDYIVDMANGVLVQPNDSEALRTAIQQLLMSSELEKSLGQNALKTVLTHHTFDQYVSRILGLARTLADSTITEHQ